MKTVEHYICETCGTEYNNKEQCRRCEENHKKPKNIIKSRHLSVTMDKTGYPETIDVRMSDGKTVKYKKLRGIESEEM